MTVRDATDLVEVSGLTKHFPLRKGLFSRQVGAVRAVDDVSFVIRRGETLGLVGESGCGKSTTGRLIMRLIPPTEGGILFDGVDLSKLEGSALRRMRRQFQMVVQDPFNALNPRMTVAETIGEPLYLAGQDRTARERRVKELLEVVGLASYHAERYPHEFSGGQRQRIGIARALAVKPKFIVCDEPVSALDVSIQAQVVNLLKDLQREYALTYLFVSHDLGVVRHISDRVAVMYLGKIVELADKRRLYSTPKHPYTQALLSAVPVPRPGARRDRVMLTGDVPSARRPPSGCRFHTRCPLADETCRQVEPPLIDVGNNHYAACHRVTKGSERDDA